jgi:hypothetical protein
VLDSPVQVGRSCCCGGRGIERGSSASPFEVEQHWRRARAEAYGGRQRKKTDVTHGGEEKAAPAK